MPYKPHGYWLVGHVNSVIPAKAEIHFKAEQKPLDSVVRFLHYKKSPVGMTEFERLTKKNQ
jgi:hypothetical protein